MSSRTRAWLEIGLCCFFGLCGGITIGVGMVLGMPIWLGIVFIVVACVANVYACETIYRRYTVEADS